MKVGQKIRTVYGQVGTVLRVNDNMLWTDIDCGSYVHVTKCVAI